MHLICSTTPLQDNQAAQGRQCSISIGQLSVAEQDVPLAFAGEGEGLFGHFKVEED